MSRSFLILLIITIVGLPSISFGQEVPYTLEDRERLVRLETKFQEGQQTINQRFEKVDQQFNNVNQRIDDLREDMRDMRNFMLWGFGILFGGIFGLMTIVIWDRRTALTPAVKKTKELEQREDLIEKILKDFAIAEPRLAEVMKSTGLL